MKLADKISQWQQEHGNRPFISLEFFPPKTDTGRLNLYQRFERFSAIHPLWIGITWGARGTTAQATLELCAEALRYHNMEPLMHLTCADVPEDLLKETLEQGIRNILALRGDPVQEERITCRRRFSFAVDLVRYIKEQYGDFFCVAVAGYPEGHPENPDREDDLRRLKEKVDAGAEVILTQPMFDVPIFKEFLAKCRDIGINVPIIPSILPLQSYAGFSRFTTCCKSQIPPRIVETLETIKTDDQAVKDFGVVMATKMCRELLTLGVPGIHFYTMNLEVSVLRIVDSLNIVDYHLPNRPLPWKPRRLSGWNSEKSPESNANSSPDLGKNEEAPLGRRLIALQRQPLGEDVRPIFWSNRPKSYIYRTAGWDDFPNGRWGNRDSPAYGEPFYSIPQRPDNHCAALRRAQWGETLSSEADVIAVFVNYLKYQNPVKRLPWTSEMLNEETNVVKKLLIKLNTLGICTINSQPRVNGALSTDPIFGWGPPGGFVYQKAYIEFFCAPNLWKSLEAKIESFNGCPSGPILSFMATKKQGLLSTNVETFGGKSGVNAVTWGVFPNLEIRQPTVVDLESFIAWKDEAFELWTIEWASIYPPDSLSRRVIDQVTTTWYLVNIVDNNVLSGDLFGTLIVLLSS